MKAVCLFCVQNATELPSFSQLECSLYNTFVWSCQDSDIFPLHIALMEKQHL